LPIGQLAPKVAILGHADLGVPKLITDLAGRHVGIIKTACGGAVGSMEASVFWPGRSRLLRAAPYCRARGPAWACAAVYMQPIRVSERLWVKS
jgi:hypothetical protein